MSRSYKKNKWVKDPSNSYMKKISSRIFRRITKHRMVNYDEDSNNLPFKQTEAIDSYSVCDYKMTCSESNCWCLKKYGYEKCYKK